MKLRTYYLLLDAARLQHHLQEAKAFDIIHSSLYIGQSEKNWIDVSPYIFKLQKDLEFIGWYKQYGWGNSWGVLLKSDHSFEELFKHFQKFLLVKTEDGQELYFRFYDPRVLRIFLPTCDKEQILEFFGPVDYFITEAENSEEAIVFKHKNGELIQERIPASRVFNELVEDNAVESAKKESEVNTAQSENKRPPRRFIY